MKKLFIKLYLLIIFSLTILSVTVYLLLGYAFDTAEKSEYREMIKGDFFLFNQILERTPKEKWVEKVSDLGKEFGYSISVMPLPDVLKIVNNNKALFSGQIVISESADFFCQRVGNSSKALVMGPFSYAGYYSWAILLGMVVLFAGMAVSVFFWVRPLWKDLDSLASAASDFGKGVLERRAKIRSGSAVSEITSTFNHMADRIQHLISLNRDMYSGISHDLRTPISRMRFGIEIAGDTDNADDIREQLKDLTGDLDELDSMIKELLIYARFERQIPELIMEHTDVNAWCSSIINGVAHLFHKKEININTDISNVGRRVTFDASIMGRSLTNILTNAANSAKSKIDVFLKSDGREVLIRVDDDGPGIPPEERKRVFEPFIRAGGGKKEKSSGHGLGLAVAAKAVEWHQGSISVSDSPLGGARFCISWPAQ